MLFYTWIEPIIIFKKPLNCFNFSSNCLPWAWNYRRRIYCGMISIGKGIKICYLKLKIFPLEGQIERKNRRKIGCAWFFLTCIFYRLVYKNRSTTYQALGIVFLMGKFSTESNLWVNYIKNELWATQQQIFLRLFLGFGQFSSFLNFWTLKSHLPKKITFWHEGMVQIHRFVGCKEIVKFSK